jgi:acyl-CoA synthetase (AMP-forming)/AMP-acid ligase II
VIAVPDSRWGERPRAFVVLAAGQHADQAELIAHVKAQIAKFKAPKSVDFVLEVPRTSTGKLRKQQLRDVERAGISGNGQDARVPTGGVRRGDDPLNLGVGLG